MYKYDTLNSTFANQTSLNIGKQSQAKLTFYLMIVSLEIM